MPKSGGSRYGCRDFVYRLLKGLAGYLDLVIDDQEVVIIRRRGARDVAMIPADELSSLTETAHLLRSPNNAQRLMQSLKEVERGGGDVTTVEEVRHSVGMDKER